MIFKRYLTNSTVWYYTFQREDGMRTNGNSILKIAIEEKIYDFLEPSELLNSNIHDDHITYQEVLFEWKHADLEKMKEDLECLLV